MRRLALATAAVVAAIVWVVVAAPPASAHAVLRSTSPADRARLDEPPSEVVLEFDQGVSATLGAVRVFDTTGARVDEGAVDVQGAVLRVAVVDGLDDGAYIVAWRAVSADSHPIHGAFTFTVGDAEEADDATVAGILGDDDETAYEVAGAAGRTVAYAGTLLAAGLGVFLALAHDGGPEATRLRRVVRWAAAFGAAGVVVAVPIRAALATGLGVSSISEPGVLDQVLRDGVLGSTIATVAGLAVVAFDGGRRPLVSLAAGAVSVGAFAFAGHTVTSDPAWLSIIGDVAHTNAGAVWLGGLVGVVWVLRSRRGDEAASAVPVVARFSGVATLALLAAATAGTALAWNEVRSISALTDTTYGRLLLAKVAVVAAVAALGGWNRFKLVPAMAGAPSAVAARLRRFVGVEAASLVVALGVTALLVNVTPARAAAGMGGVFSTDVPFGDGTLTMVVDPNRAGFNSIHLYTLDEAGRVADPGGPLLLSLSLPAAEIGPIEREPFVAGPGHWQLDGTDLSISGTWTIEVSARVSRFDEVTASVDVPVNP